MASTKGPYPVRLANDYWYARYPVRNTVTGKIRWKEETLGTRDKDEALRRFATWLTDHTQLDDSDVGLTYQMAANDYFSYAESRRVATARTMRTTHWERFWQPTIGHLVIGKGDAPLIADVMTAAKNGTLDMSHRDGQGSRGDEELSDGYICNIIATLSRVLNHAVKRTRRLDSRSVPPLPTEYSGSKSRKAYFTVEQRQDLLDYVYALSPPEGRGRLHPLHLFVVLGLFTGARRNTILHTRASMIDFKAKRLFWRRDLEGRLCENVKSQKRFVDFPLRDPELVAILQRACREVEDKRPIHSWLFTDRSSDAMVNEFEDAMVELGHEVPKAQRTRKKEYVPHTMRHTFATLLLLADAPMAKVAALMGDTLTTIQNTYGHLLAEDAAKYLDVLNIPTRPHLRLVE